ncbi:hypothetical protein PQ459_08175 [Chryseobacterium sp. KACC 21268]|nr:hypothetical protein PQ459_08175 [Chryseobacterium sp. KACC 21268]
MKSINRNQILSLSKRILFVALVVFGSTFLQIYWSMGQFADQMSSACLECWFVEDAFYMSVMTSVFLAIVFNFLEMVQSRVFRIVVQFLLLISAWFFLDYSIFVERESSWSTYHFNEELYYVATLSFLSILILSCLNIMIINYKSFLKI